MQEGASRNGIGVGPSFALHHSQAKAKSSYIFAEWTKNQAPQITGHKGNLQQDFSQARSKNSNTEPPHVCNNRNNQEQTFLVGVKPL